MADWIACDTCRIRHKIAVNSDEASEFIARHQGHSIRLVKGNAIREFLSRALKADTFRLRRETNNKGDRELVIDYERFGLAGYSGNANIKIAFGTAVDMTVTNLHSNASSATNVWGSASVDNATNLYLDYLIHFVLDFANTAPANSKAAFLLGYGVADEADTTFTQPFSGSEGDFTVLDFTANPLVAPVLGSVPYGTADEVVESAVFSVANGFGGILPAEFGVGIINHSGAALAASGNIVTYRGLYGTVA